MKNLNGAYLIILTLCYGIFAEQELRINSQNLYAAILAGGSGERLWPLSRQQKPKQLLEIAQKGTLLDQAIDRIMDYIPKENILISTTLKFASIINEYVGSRIGQVICEPSARNTAPAILLTCMKIAQLNPDAVVIFLPADPFIPRAENAAFADSIKQALNFVAENDCIALLGVKPTDPSTAYGYIEYDQTAPSDSLTKIVSFHEKPSLDKAVSYLAQGNMLWNTGMFCGKASVFIKEFQQHSPEVYKGIVDFLAGNSSYDKIPSISIDYAVIEKSKHTYVLPINLTWYDVGNLQVFLSLKQQYEGFDTTLVTEDARNNLVDVPKHLVALVGVDDLCVYKSDDVIIIAKNSATEKIRAIVNQLKKENSPYL